MDEYAFRRFARLKSEDYAHHSRRFKSIDASEQLEYPNSLEMSSKDISKENAELKSEICRLRQHLHEIQTPSEGEDFVTRYYRSVTNDAQHYSDLYSNQSIRQIKESLKQQRDDLQLMRTDSLATVAQIKKIESKITELKSSRIFVEIMQQRNEIDSLKRRLADAVSVNRSLKSEYDFFTSLTGVATTDTLALEEDLRSKMQIFHETDAKYTKLLESQKEEVEVFTRAKEYFKQARELDAHPTMEVNPAPTKRSLKLSFTDDVSNRGVSKSITVGPFSTQISRSELVSLFDKFGEIVDAEVRQKPNSEKYYGNIRFTHLQSAKKAISKMSEFEYNGDAVTVKWAANQR